MENKKPGPPPFLRRASTIRIDKRYIDKKEFELDSIMVLGKGVYGKVELCKWTKIKTHVAIKTPLIGDKSKEEEKDLIKALIKERENHINFIHDHIVRLYGYTRIRNQTGLVLEYMKGGSLLKLINNKEINYTFSHVLLWACGIASALEYLMDSKREFIHGDLKPDNMVLNETGLILKLCDFGNACKNKEAKDVVGSPTFMSPEMYERYYIGESNKKIQSRYKGRLDYKKCDVYSYAASFWHCVMREPPFQKMIKKKKIKKRQDFLDLLREAKKKCLKFESKVETLGRIPEEFNTLIQRSSSPKPEERPNMEEVLTELEALKNGYDRPEPLKLVKDQEASVNENVDTQNQNPINASAEIQNQNPVNDNVETENQNPLIDNVETQNQNPPDDKIEIQNQNSLNDKVETQNPVNASAKILQNSNLEKVIGQLNNLILNNVEKLSPPTKVAESSKEIPKRKEEPLKKKVKVFSNIKKMLVLGGLSSGKGGLSYYHRIVESIDEFKQVNDQSDWNRFNLLPENDKRLYPRYAYLDGIVYMCGGVKLYNDTEKSEEDDRSKRLFSAEFTDSGPLTWKVRTPMRTERASFGFAALELANVSFLMAAGGMKSCGLTNTVELFNLNEDENDRMSQKWKYVAPLKMACFGHELVVRGDKILSIGGGIYGQRFKNVQSFDFYTNQWTDLPSTKYAYSNFGACYHDGSVYACNGRSFEVLHKGSNQWQALPIFPQRVSPVKIKSGHTEPIEKGTQLTSWNGKIWSTGGMNESDSEASDQVWMFDPRNQQWQSAAPMPIAKGYHRALVIDY